MRSKLEKDKILRRQFQEFETDWFLLKPLIRSAYFKGSFLRKAVQFPSLATPCGRIRNRCTVTGRAGSVYRDFRMSRATIRKFVSEGRLSGVTRSSW